MMTVKGICTSFEAKWFNEAELEREVRGVYAGDLLSWVMGHAREDQILVTIMSNLNVLAVASLLDLSLVVLSEGVEPDEDFIKTAKDKKINVVSTKLATYEVCVKLSQMLGK